MFTNLLFLSHGIQIALFLLLVGLVLVFMKMTTFEKRLKNMENHMMKYVTYEDYMETFNNMWEAKMSGDSVAPFPDADLPEVQAGQPSYVEEVD